MRHVGPRTHRVKHKTERSVNTTYGFRTIAAILVLTAGLLPACTSPTPPSRPEIEVDASGSPTIIATARPTLTERPTATPASLTPTSTPTSTPQPPTETATPVPPTPSQTPVPSLTPTRQPTRQLPTATLAGSPTAALELTEYERTVQGTYLFFVGFKTCGAYGGQNFTSTLTLVFANSNFMTLSSNDPFPGLNLGYTRLGPNQWATYRDIPPYREEITINIGENAFSLKSTTLTTDNQQITECRSDWLRILN